MKKFKVRNLTFVDCVSIITEDKIPNWLSGATKEEILSLGVGRFITTDFQKITRIA